MPTHDAPRTWAAVMALAATSLGSAAQPVAADPPAPDWARPMATSHETVVDLGHGVHAITSDAWPLAGNVTVAVGTEGVIVVDTQFGGLYPKLRSSVSAISSRPVKFVVDTHHHRDHVGGNEAFAADGATIVAQAKAAEHMALPPRREDGSPGLHMESRGLPWVMYDGAGLTLQVGAQTAQLHHPAAPAHTDGDTFVYFPEANVVSTGDLFDSLLYPGLDLQFGATIDGLIAAVRQIDALADDATRIVPGHGKVSSKADLREYLAMLLTARSRVAKAKADGMTEQQVATANLLADLDRRWLLLPSRAARFPTAVYRSLPPTPGSDPTPPAAAFEFVAPDGDHLAYRVQGRGETVVVLPGGPGLRADYIEPLAAAIAALHYRAVTLELRGTGASLVGCTACLSMAGSVEDIESLRVALGLDRMVLLGHSFGGAMAQAYAAAHPTRVARLVLLDSAGPELSPSPDPAVSDNFLKRMTVDEQARYADARTRGDVSAAIRLKFAASFVDPAKGADFVAGLTPGFVRPDVAHRVSADFRARYRITSAGAFPVALVFGEDDWIRAWQPALEHVYGAARVILVPRSGHFPWLDQPTATAEALRSSLAP